MLYIFEVWFLCLWWRSVAFLNSHFHSLHVSNEVHWDSNLVTLPYPSSLHSLPAPPLSFQSTPENDTWMTHTYRNLTISTPHFQILSRYLMILIISPSSLIVFLSCNASSSCSRCLYNTVQLRYFKPELRTSSTSLLCYFLLISCPVVFIHSPHSCLFIFSLLLPIPPPYRPQWQQKHGVGCCRRWRGKEKGACKWSFVSVRVLACIQNGPEWPETVS